VPFSLSLRIFRRILFSTLAAPLVTDTSVAPVKDADDLVDLFCKSNQVLTL